MFYGDRRVNGKDGRNGGRTPILGESIFILSEVRVPNTNQFPTAYSSLQQERIATFISPNSAEPFSGMLSEVTRV